MLQDERSVTTTEEPRSPLRRRSAGLRLALVVGLAAMLAGAALAGGAGGRSSPGPAGRPRSLLEVPATGMDRSLTPANNSPALVADPTNSRFVVMANRLDAPDFSCALQVSGDGGRGWLPARPISERPEGIDKCYAPEAAFDRTGRLYYLFVGLAGTGNEPVGAFLTYSSDRAQTWSPPRRILDPFNFGVRMAIDPEVGTRGRIHLVWLHASSDPPTGGFGPPPNPILTAYSDDGGRTFSPPVQVSDPARERVVAPALVLGPDHAVHVGYYDLGDDARDYQGLEGPTWEGTWSVVVASSADGGRHFGAGSVVDDAVRPAERVMLIFTTPPPSLAASRDGRRLCAAWTDARNGDADAVLRCSTTGGRTWQDLRRLNDDPVGSGPRQYLPRISFAPDGRLDAVFLDRRDSPSDLPNLTNDAYYTFSTDGGSHFAGNMKLTHQSSVSVIGQQYANVSAAGQYEFGSRLGLVSRDDGAVTAWPDTRNSVPPGPAQDIFTAVVVHPVARSKGAGLRLAGGILLAGGLATVGAALVTRRRRAGGRS